MNALEFIITALAVYGISALVSQYDGYKDSFIKLREKYPRSAFICAVCLSVWLVIPLYLVALLNVWMVAPLAIIGVVILLEKIR